jgi:hypothetical protein
MVLPPATVERGAGEPFSQSMASAAVVTSIRSPSMRGTAGAAMRDSGCSGALLCPSIFSMEDQ